MPTAECHLEEIAMDMIGESPESEGFHAILVVTDWFTKLQHYISRKTTWAAADVTNAYIHQIWRLYSLPSHVTSYCGLQFASTFLQELN